MIILDRNLQKKSGIYPIFKSKDAEPKILSSKHVTHIFLIPYLLNLISYYNVVGIVRNPCAVLASFKNYASDFNPVWNFEDEWEFSPNRGGFRPENYFGFHRWKEFVKLLLVYKSKHSKRVYIIRYENLVLNPQIEIKKCLIFFNLDVSNQTLEFLSESTSLKVEHTLSVYKGSKDLNSWKEELDNKIISRIYSDLSNTEFEQFL